MGRDWGAEREEEERWLQARLGVPVIEAGEFLCPWCQKYVDPRKWWTHIDASPYDDAHDWGPTLFHRGCGAQVPPRRQGWVKALRAQFDRSPIKPGDYVKMKWHAKWGKLPGRVLRVIDIRTDEYDGVTEDDPYYLVDTTEIDARSWSYYAGRKEFDLVGRPYLAEQGPEPS